jgi:hypothetical protein
MYKTPYTTFVPRKLMQFADSVTFHPIEKENKTFLEEFQSLE